MPRLVIGVVVLALLVGMLVMRLRRRKIRYSKRQIVSARHWKDGTAEKKVASKISALQAKLEGLVSRRRMESERVAREAAFERKERDRDASGRLIYGDAWDDPECGLRHLLGLSDQEVAFFQAEAKKRLLEKKKDPRGLPDDLREDVMNDVDFFKTPQEAFTQTPQEAFTPLLGTHNKKTTKRTASVARVIPYPPLPPSSS